MEYWAIAWEVWKAVPHKDNTLWVHSVPIESWLFLPCLQLSGTFVIILTFGRTAY
jgi:hypothetical protein